jgi:hypothetical protein
VSAGGAAATGPKALEQATIKGDAKAQKQDSEPRKGLRWVSKCNLVNRVEARLCEAQTLLAIDRAAEARAACEAGLAIHRHQPDALDMTARCLVALGRTPEAAPFLAEAELLAFESEQAVDDHG